jgi:hypothetical protein
MDALSGMNGLLIYAIIRQLAWQQSEIRRFGGEFGAALSDVWRYVIDHHPRPDAITLAVIEQALKDLHNAGKIYLQNWDGEQYVPWRSDWHDFFSGGFRLCAEKP